MNWEEIKAKHQVSLILRPFKQKVFDKLNARLNNTIVRPKGDFCSWQNLDLYEKQDYVRKLAAITTKWRNHFPDKKCDKCKGLV